MEYAINIAFLAKEIGLETASALVSKAGFTELDYTPPIEDEDWKVKMKGALEIFADNGLSVYQTHAPFNRYGKYGNMHKLYVDRCAEATELMGAKFMVAHGDEFDFENLTFTPEAALDYNHNFFLPYVTQGEKAGYKVAFETVFEDLNRRRYTSQAEELLALITSYQSDSVVCCWDFGHANITFKKEAPNVIRTFGKLIQCTHLHDNTGKDSHQMPMTGDINWKDTMGALKEIGYEGVLSVEYAHGNMPEHLMESFITLTYQTAKHLWEM